MNNRRPSLTSAAGEIPPFSHGGGPGPHLCHHMTLYTLTSICGGKEGDKKLPFAHGGGPLEPQGRHQNRLFSANVALFSMLNRPYCC
jgi:hypothetical protein